MSRSGTARHARVTPAGPGGGAVVSRRVGRAALSLAVASAATLAGVHLGNGAPSVSPVRPVVGYVAQAHGG